MPLLNFDRLDEEEVPGSDELSALAAQVEAAFAAQDFDQAAELLEGDPIGVWFGMSPFRTFEIFGQVLEHVPAETTTLRALQIFLTTDAVDSLNSQDHLSRVNFDDPREVHIVTLLRMFSFRSRGHMRASLEQGETIQKSLGAMQSFANVTGSAVLHTSVQIGITSMLAGDFTRALMWFTRAEMHPVIPKFRFLSRDALVKGALIHACFGNASTAVAMLERAERFSRTTSWAEAHIDAHRDFARILTMEAPVEETLEALESISLHNIGELWPFYVFAVHRVLEEAGYHDELDHRFEMYESMPFTRVDGDGFTGSIVPLKRGLIALRAGRITEGQGLLDQADQKLLYTRLMQAAAHLYAVRPQQAKQEALQLRTETRGFRLMEVRRMAILAAAFYLGDELAECVETLTHASELPGGLHPNEALLFSTETRKIAEENIPDWPVRDGSASVFLSNLPQAGVVLTEREIEIIQHLAMGHTRAVIAEALFISINTLKTHLKSIYRKLNVSSAAEALIGAQQRGLL